MEKLFDLFYECKSVCTDTRKITPDCLFICLSGSNFNGNTFANQALELGAKYVIIDDKQFANSSEIYLVDNCLIFLQKLANFHRKKFNLPVIGITGSNGKTSTKELINCVLSKKYKTLATIGNLNNHIGVPLTLLNLNKTHEIAIIEMGANKFKDIEELCEIAEPNFGIITNIGKAHLEGFINFEGVLKTKTELYHSVSTNKGVLFFNLDDEILKSHLPKNTESFSFGTDKTADIVGELIGLTPFVNLKWTSKTFHSEELQTAMIGKYNFYNFLAAIAFGSYFNVPNEAISEAITEYQPTNNRSQIQKTKKNTLILDAYNANPTSMRSAIESFAIIENHSKIAILGDMFELGSESQKEHEQIVSMIEDLNIKAFFVGKRFFESKNKENNKIKFFEDKIIFKEYLDKNEFSDTLILLKGSRGIGLEELVEKL
ncbi:MAG: UDP-N-acetylmuramoyl-tripeptide--D-alanyl-D-alanine ligase [Flavobacteriia bacterium]|jgi:UDP-N-acetylmuramoyl-tripeptide--D-alanyl-D-alanine ligase